MNAIAADVRDPGHAMGEGVRPSGPVAAIGSLAAATLLAWPLAGVLQYNRARVDAGELWRLATCQWTHWSADHLLWDVAVFVALGLACARRGLGATLSTIALAAIAVPVAVHVACPTITTFRGLSGVDSALFGLALTRVARRERPRDLAIAAAFAVGFVAKVVYESITGATVFASAAGDYAVVPMAHGVGFIVGVLIASRLGRCQYRRRGDLPKSLPSMADDEAGVPARASPARSKVRAAEGDRYIDRPLRCAAADRPPTPAARIRGGRLALTRRIRLLLGSRQFD